MNIIGVDQSLSKMGVSTISISDSYSIELKKYILILKEFLDIFNKKSTNLKKLTAKSKLKKFNFLEFIQECNYTKKEKEDLEEIYKRLLSLQEEIKNNNDFSNMKDYYDVIKGKKSTTFDLDYIGSLIVSKETSVVRLKEYKDLYSKYLEDNNPFLIAMEGYSYDSTNTRSVFDLGELGGMIRLENYTKNYTTVIVTPSSLKMFMRSDGKADKIKMIRSVESLFNIKFEKEKKNGEFEKLDDIYDAFSLSMFCILIPYMDITDSLKCKII